MNFNSEGADTAAPHIGMAPLVDIVLLLICFYLLVMQSMQSRADDQINLPKMANNETSDVAPAELVVNIGATGTINLNGTPVDMDGLGALLRSERSRAEASGAGLDVVIRADGRQSYGLLDAALGACRDAGLQGAIIRTTENRP
jgi:biopolymer transport protein ExbD